MAKDPVCNMEVDEETAEFESQYASQTYYFCSAECQEHLNLGQNNMRVLHKKLGVPVSDGTPFVAAEN